MKEERSNEQKNPYPHRIIFPRDSLPSHGIWTARGEEICWIEKHTKSETKNKIKDGRVSEEQVTISTNIPHDCSPLLGLSTSISHLASDFTTPNYTPGSRLMT